MSYKDDLESHASPLTPTSDVDDTAPDASDAPGNLPEPDIGRPEILSGPDSPLARRILSYLLKHQGERVRFEASQRTTESGILRGLPGEDPAGAKRTLHVLAELRIVLRRSQYVVGYSDPKMVYVLTSAGRRRAPESRPDTLSEQPSEPALR